MHMSNVTNRCALLEGCRHRLGRCRPQSLRWSKIFARASPISSRTARYVLATAAYVEAIAAFNGAQRELAIVTERASALWRHVAGVVRTQWWYGIVEDVSAIHPLPSIHPHTQLHSLNLRLTLLPLMVSLLSSTAPRRLPWW